MENNKRRSVHTDLAMEACELNPDLPGVTEETETDGNIKISRITITNADSAKKLGKACGRFITLDAPDLQSRDTDTFEAVSVRLSTELLSLFPKTFDKSSTVLVVGLGNRYITPDSLGPRVVEKTFVTRQLTEYMSDALAVPLAPVCAIAPGVLGVTGIESYDIIFGLAKKLKPNLIIAIDALASRRAARLSTTVQLTDTGISPGSGIGNLRAGIDLESLSIPVIAIGVPLVVYASTIAQDTISLIADKRGLHNDEGLLLELAEEVISENMGQMIVTPKEIDTTVSDMAGTVAKGINLALHGEELYSDLASLLS